MQPNQTLRYRLTDAIAKANDAPILPRRSKMQSLLTSRAKNFTGEEVAAG
ncbi:hypothetical protein FHS27_001304 [Rhodopirellula rubra]|uniref:Uncharacterized protein n=1 Tax=Aporhodopirellula rubra TaxID=980271 RepID=A0A7W5DWL2_9BACT|nr:hypothetical protein [Aporhodopirellula rubra]MBB3205504.1 hypothetical protein [Aporhodopirellula rubra]